MSANYLNEAFTQLQLLNEEEFNLTDKDSIEDIKSLVDAPVDASIDIIDPDANSEDELSDSYVGKVVLDCSKFAVSKSIATKSFISCYFCFALQR